MMEKIKSLLEEFFVLWKSIKPNYMKLIFPFYAPLIYIIGKTIRKRDPMFVRRNIWAKFDYIVKINEFRFISEKSFVSMHIVPLYERKLYSYLKHVKGDIFIDVGSHAGRYSITLSKNFKKILAIEPDPYNFAYLIKNIYLNNLQDKIQPLNVALSDKIGFVKFYLENIGGGTHSIVIKKNKYIYVLSLTLDYIIEQLKIDPKDISLIKIDVEGAEYYVLKGMTKILKEGSPIIVVEIWDNNEKKEDVIKLLESFGYKLKKIFDEQGIKNYLFVKEK